MYSCSHTHLHNGRKYDELSLEDMEGLENRANMSEKKSTINLTIMTIFIITNIDITETDTRIWYHRVC